jgi:1-acyl-sn-glycerol-3-phosphate acyltransferase
MSKRFLVYSVTKSIAQAVFPLFYSIETVRDEPLPVEGPAVILPKHQSWTDIPLVCLSFPVPLYYVAKKELFRYPGIRAYLRLAGGIPLDREQSIRTLESMKQLATLLKNLEKVVIFPEGTYVPNVVGPGKSRLIQFILRLQAELGRPIPFFPMGIRYGDRKGWKRRVEIRIGSPLLAEKESDASFLTERIMKEIGRLSGLPLRSECNPSVMGGPR